MSDNGKEKKANSPVGNSQAGEIEDNQDIIMPRSDSNTTAKNGEKNMTDKHSQSMAVPSEQKQKENGKRTSTEKERYYNSNTSDDKKELLGAADRAKKRMIQQMYVDKVNAARSGNKPSAGAVAAAVAMADKAEVAAVTSNRVENIKTEKTVTAAVTANHNVTTSSYRAPVSSLKAAHDSNNYTRKGSALQQTNAKSAQKRFYIKNKTTIKVSKERQKQREFFTRKIVTDNYRRKVDRYYQHKTDEVLKRSEQKVEKINKEGNAEKSSFISASANAAAAAGMAKAVHDAVQSGNAAAALTAVPAEIIRNNFSKALSDTSVGQLTEGISTVTDTIKHSDNAADAVASVTGKIISDKVKKDFGNSYQAYRNKCAEARRDRRIEAVYKKQDKALSEIQHNKAAEMTSSPDKAAIEKINKRDMEVNKAKFKLSKKRQIKSKVFKKKDTARQGFSRAGKGVESAAKKAVGKKISAAVLGSGILPIILVFVIVIVLLNMLAQAFAPIGWLFGKPDSDPAMEGADDTERLCVAAEKVRKDYDDRIATINAQISAAINDSNYWYEDDEGILQIAKGRAFAVVENEFWHYSDDPYDTIQVGEVKAKRKYIDELPIVYKGKNPEYWADSEMVIPENFDFESASFVDLMNIDYMYEIISEDEFDFYEFCVYYQVYNIKKKYPGEKLENHMDEMFELNDEEAYDFFERRIKYKHMGYFAYHFAGDTANGLPIYVGADTGMEQRTISIFREASFWGYYNQCYCKQIYYDNCCGHHSDIFILKIVPYTEIFEEDGITITEEDEKIIEQLKISMEMLKTEIVPEVMETYVGTYFND